ncbi:MAG: PorT family protein [Bacteroidales bacterium]|nr:PorT family protein [Bacteroidales bacterium]
MSIVPKRIRYTLYILCAMCATVCAQETVRQPDLQVADNSFFDPTRKDKKKDTYQFGVEYRIEAGYVQANQRTNNYSYPDMFLHGARIGATFTFLLPIRFSLQTGVLYSIAYGRNEQHWRSMDAASVQTEYIQHRILEHNLTIPVRCYYTIPLWRQLNMFFYGGPQLQIGLAQNDYMRLHLSEGTLQWLQQQDIATEPYDRLGSGELYRTNIQMGLGGGFEWDRYRLQAGYDFGLNNLVKNKIIDSQHLWEWSWYVSFSYKF